MSNDWSLKLKEQYLEDEDRYIEYYSKQSIQKLRKKLIERCEKQIKTIENDIQIPIGMATHCKFYPKQMIDYINYIFGERDD